MKSLLFVCIHNSARSQMAEAYARQFAGEKFHCYSAGIEPGKLNANVVAIMAEDGIDISAQTCRSVDQHLREQGQPDLVITVCDETNAQRCPTFSGGTQRLHWSFDDPSALAGSDADKLQQSRLIRDQIKRKVEQWAQSVD